MSLSTGEENLIDQVNTFYHTAFFYFSPLNFDSDLATSVFQLLLQSISKCQSHLQPWLVFI